MEKAKDVFILGYYESIFSSSVPYGVSKLAALAEALITLGSP